jgi:hypothetical protein
MNYIEIFILLTCLICPSPVEALAGLAEFESLPKLQEFVNDYCPTIRLQADESGQIQINNQCEDIAIGLRDKALKVGRLLETEILIQSEVLKYYPAEFRPDAPHMICKAIIGNEVYFIEPATRTVWMAYYLD